MNFFSNLFAKTPPKSYSTDPSSSIALGPDDDVPGPGQQFSQFGAGSFWGVELAFQRVPGVTKTEVGYSHGVVHNPSYNDVCSETTKHLEVARVQYDPSESSFGDLLDVFWSRHDPTTINRQAGCGIGGMLSAIHGFNTGIPFVQNHVKGPKWLPFVIGVPPLLMFSAASAAFGGYALPKFTQLTVTSYYAASSASHYGISLLIRRIEETNTPHSKSEKIS